MYCDATDHDLLGQQAVFAEHTAVPSSAHPCPYVAYYGPIHSSSSNTIENVSDNSNFSNHWAGPSGSSEIPGSYAFAAMDPHYHSWEHHSLPVSATGGRIGGSDQPSGPSMTQRSSRSHPDIPRPGSFVHPFIASQRYGLRAILFFVLFFGFFVSTLCIDEHVEITSFYLFNWIAQLSASLAAESDFWGTPPPNFGYCRLSDGLLNCLVFPS